MPQHIRTLPGLDQCWSQCLALSSVVSSAVSMDSKSNLFRRNRTHLGPLRLAKLF